MHLAAYTATVQTGEEKLRSVFPMPLSRGFGLNFGIAQTGLPAVVEDIETDPEYDEPARAVARARGYRGIIGVPLLHKGKTIGAFAVTRSDPGSFTQRQMDLLRTLPTTQ